MDSVFSTHFAHTLYWCMAVFGSTFLVIQLIMTLFGFGMDHADVDATSDGVLGPDAHHGDLSGVGTFNLFSVRSLFAFVTFFGWGGVFWGDNLLGFCASFGLGVAMMFVTASIFYFMMKLQESGNIRSCDMVGKTGSVYMTIPAGREKHGIVTVSMGTCTREVMAVADVELKTGVAVKLTSCVDGKRYFVEKC